jgi:hypothetical protein
MAGAKQLVTLGFILVPARGRTYSRAVLEALYCVAPRCLQRGATSEAGEEAGPPGPEVLIEASANIVVKAESVQVCAVRRLCGWGTAPPFIGQGGGSLQACRTVCLRVEAWCTVLWSRRLSWRILHLAGRHGVPCIRPGAVSRVAL